MTKYEVVITEFLEKVVYIEAESEDEADKEAIRLYGESEIVLDADDCVTTSTEVLKIATEEEIAECSWRPVFRKEIAK